MERPEEKTHILDIPPHILSDIMLKLPACSISRCACVCTTFRNLVTDSTFKQLYPSRAPTSCVVLSCKQVLLCIDSCALTETPPCMASLENQSSSSTCVDPILKQNTDGLQLINRTRFLTFKIPRKMHLVNSSNGLLCLSSCRIGSRSYYICNPLLGEILRVPPAPSSARYVHFSAFGFDPKSKNYKILRLSKSNGMVGEVYQLGDDTWRVIENAPTVRDNSAAFDPSLNGALHWVTHSPHVSELICSFDLHSNEFKLLAPPSHFDDTYYLLNIKTISVGVLKGSLCLCYVIGGVQFETWVMEEYGMEKSWTKAFSIDIKYYGVWLRDEHRLTGFCWAGQRPIGFSSYGDMWVKTVSSDPDFNSLWPCVVSYSAEAGIFRQIDMQSIVTIIEATPHVFSFVSLKDIVNVSDTHLKIRKLLKPNKTDAFGFNNLNALPN